MLKAFLEKRLDPKRLEFKPKNLFIK